MSSALTAFLKVHTTYNFVCTTQIAVHSAHLHTQSVDIDTLECCMSKRHVDSSNCAPAKSQLSDSVDCRC